MSACSRKETYMSNNKTTDNHKNLTFEERRFIEDSLNNKSSFKEIALNLGRNPRTISREVKRGFFTREKDHNLRKGTCGNKNKCKQKNLCFPCLKPGTICKECSYKTCAIVCSFYTPGCCDKLGKAPYVCNPCKKYTSCGFDKKWYRANHADKAYTNRMVTSRLGINLSLEEINELDELITPLIAKGQSIAHIYANHSDRIKCSKRTLYTYVDLGLFKVRNIDLPRKVRYKPRKKHKQVKTDYAYRQGRSYEEFTKFIGNNPDLNVVEMDVVQGRKGGKVFLTLLFRASNLMLIYLMDSASEKCVEEVFDHLNERLLLDGMKSLFSVVLTDNGSEFKDPEALEFDAYGDRRCRIYYCDPHKSYQKGKLEKNHEFIRYILPKGKSFDHLNQSHATLIANHINSIARASLNDKTPFELASMLTNIKLLEKLDLTSIGHDDVHLKPALLK